MPFFKKKLRPVSSFFNLTLFVPLVLCVCTSVARPHVHVHASGQCGTLQFVMGPSTVPLWAFGGPDGAV